MKIYEKNQTVKYHGSISEGEKTSKSKRACSTQQNKLKGISIIKNGAS